MKRESSYRYTFSCIVSKESLKRPFSETDPILGYHNLIFACPYFICVGTETENESISFFTP